MKDLIVNDGNAIVALMFSKMLTSNIPDAHHIFLIDLCKHIHRIIEEDEYNSFIKLLKKFVDSTPGTEERISTAKSIIDLEFLNPDNNKVTEGTTIP